MNLIHKISNIYQIIKTGVKDVINTVISNNSVDDDLFEDPIAEDPKKKLRRQIKAQFRKIQKGEPVGMEELESFTRMILENTEDSNKKLRSKIKQLPDKIRKGLKRRIMSSGYTDIKKYKFIPEDLQYYRRDELSKMAEVERQDSNNQQSDFESKYTLKNSLANYRRKRKAEMFSSEEDLHKKSKGENEAAVKYTSIGVYGEKLDFLYYEGDLDIVSCPRKFIREKLNDETIEMLKHKYKGEETPRQLKWSRVPEELQEVYFSKENVEKIHAYMEKVKRRDARKYGKYNTVEYFNECQAKAKKRKEGVDMTDEIKKFCQEYKQTIIPIDEKPVKSTKRKRCYWYPSVYKSLKKLKPGEKEVEWYSADMHEFGLNFSDDEPENEENKEIAKEMEQESKILPEYEFTNRKDLVPLDNTENHDSKIIDKSKLGIEEEPKIETESFLTKDEILLQNNKNYKKKRVTFNLENNIIAIVNTDSETGYNEAEITSRHDPIMISNDNPYNVNESNLKSIEKLHSNDNLLQDTVNSGIKQISSDFISEHEKKYNTESDSQQRNNRNCKLKPPSIIPVNQVCVINRRFDSEINGMCVSKPQQSNSQNFDFEIISNPCYNHQHQNQILFPQAQMNDDLQFNDNQQSNTIEPSLPLNSNFEFGVISNNTQNQVGSYNSSLMNPGNVQNAVCGVSPINGQNDFKDSMFNNNQNLVHQPGPGNNSYGSTLNNDRNSHHFTASSNNQTHDISLTNRQVYNNEPELQKRQDLSFRTPSNNIQPVSNAPQFLSQAMQMNIEKQNQAHSVNFQNQYSGGQNWMSSSTQQPSSLGISSSLNFFTAPMPHHQVSDTQNASVNPHNANGSFGFGIFGNSSDQQVQKPVCPTASFSSKPVDNKNEQSGNEDVANKKRAYFNRK